jgi:uncharacterized protein
VAVNAYFDASALVKLFVRERGWETASELDAAARHVVGSTLVHTEVRAALAAQRRASVLSAAAFERAKELAGRWRARTREVALHPRIARAAAEIAETRSLRAADAVHLATALAVQDLRLVMVTWDRRLHAASLEAGLNVAPAQI